MKYLVTIKYIEEAYVQVDADSEDEAIEIVAGMNKLELEPETDYEEYEAEELDEGNKNGPAT
jgi:hypothetical protein